MMLISLALLQAQAPSVSGDDFAAGGVVAVVLGAFKLIEMHQSRTKEKASNGSATSHNGELRAIRETMSTRFDALDTRVEDLKTDLGREIDEVKERVGDIEKRERVRLEEELKATRFDRRVAP